MIISEKQIHGLIVHVHGYIETLKQLRDLEDFLSDAGHENIDNAIQLLNAIHNQQPEELKEVKQ